MTDREHQTVTLQINPTNHCTLVNETVKNITVDEQGFAFGEISWGTMKKNLTVITWTADSVHWYGWF